MKQPLQIFLSVVFYNMCKLFFKGLSPMKFSLSGKPFIDRNSNYFSVCRHQYILENPVYKLDHNTLVNKETSFMFMVLINKLGPYWWAWCPFWRRWSLLTFLVLIDICGPYLSSMKRFHVCGYWRASVLLTCPIKLIDSFFKKLVLMSTHRKKNGTIEFLCQFN